MKIDICCNDEKNGLFNGRAVAICFGDICYESKNINGIKITDFCSRLRIHRKEFKYLSMREWVGNWCWNRYSFDSETGLMLLDLIRKSKFWYESDI